jgi:hypothetical protein
MNTKYDHFVYGEQLAAALKPISHTPTRQRFYRATEIEELEDLNARISSASSMMLVAIDGHNSDFRYRNSDSLMQRPQYFFLVLRQTVSGDVDTIFAAQSECEAVAKQIIARIVNDASHSGINPLQFVDPASFAIRGIGPVGDNFYGVILGFNVDVGMNCEIINDMWN